jgi:hypothetical protein
LKDLKSGWRSPATDCMWPQTFPPRLYVLDITDPARPVERGRVDLPAQVENHAITGVAVQDRFPYVVTDDRPAEAGTFQVVDVSDAARPKVLGNFSHQGSPTDIAVAGNFAYVPTESPGLLIVNIGDPARPFIGSVLEGDFTSSIALAGGFAYIVER